jgi:hypothetical protein
VRDALDAVCCRPSLEIADGGPSPSPSTSRRLRGHFIRRPIGQHPIEDMIVMPLNPVEKSAGGEAAMIVARSVIRGATRNDFVADGDGSSDGGAD